MPRPGSVIKEDYRARCPLHVAWREDEIMCKPALPDSTMTIHRYSDINMVRMQFKTYCCGCYERCEHYRAWRHFIWEDE